MSGASSSAAWLVRSTIVVLSVLAVMSPSVSSVDGDLLLFMLLLVGLLSVMSSMMVVIVIGWENNAAHAFVVVALISRNQ